MPSACPAYTSLRCCDLELCASLSVHTLHPCSRRHSSGAVQSLPNLCAQPPLHSPVVVKLDSQRYWPFPILTLTAKMCPLRPPRLPTAPCSTTRWGTRFAVLTILQPLVQHAVAPNTQWRLTSQRVLPGPSPGPRRAQCACKAWTSVQSSGGKSRQLARPRRQ